MDVDLAIRQYDAIVPDSYSFLRNCIGKPIQEIVWHEIGRQHHFDRLRESLELRFKIHSIFLRTPRDEDRCRDGNPIHTVEFATSSPSPNQSTVPTQTVTSQLESQWIPCLNSNIKQIEVLLDLKHEDYARYFGVRFKLENYHSLGYHYQWGETVGELIDRRPRVVVDGGNPPDSLGWQFAPWI